MFTTRSRESLAGNQPISRNLSNADDANQDNAEVTVTTGLLAPLADLARIHGASGARRTPESAADTGRSSARLTDAAGRINKRRHRLYVASTPTNAAEGPTLNPASRHQSEARKVANRRRAQRVS